MCSSMTSREIARTESGNPRAKAIPADVVARALKPRCSRYTADPTSHGFGRTKHPDVCISRKRATEEDWVDVATLTLPPMTSRSMRPPFLGIVSDGRDETQSPQGVAAGTGAIYFR